LPPPRLTPTSDWFRLETLDDSLQPTIDMLLNLSVFMWFGAVCPWASFVHNDVIPIYRLIFLGILILLFRRVPIIYALHWRIQQIEQKQQALFVGFFGPIGVSAVFYLYISVEFLAGVTVDGVEREDAKRLSETIVVVVWFLSICSIVCPCSPLSFPYSLFFLPSREIPSALCPSLLFVFSHTRPAPNRSSTASASPSENWATNSPAPSPTPSPATPTNPPHSTCPPLSPTPSCATATARIIPAAAMSVRAKGRRSGRSFALAGA
jgi:hypothetical protein